MVIQIPVRNWESHTPNKTKDTAPNRTWSTQVVFHCCCLRSAPKTEITPSNSFNNYKHTFPVTMKGRRVRGSSRKIILRLLGIASRSSPSPSPLCFCICSLCQQSSVVPPKDKTRLRIEKMESEREARRKETQRVRALWSCLDTTIG